MDDEEQNRTLLRDPLEAHGHKVAEAASGQEALELIAEKAPDVVLLDLMMPGMNGFEVCSSLEGRHKDGADSDSDDHRADGSEGKVDGNPGWCQRFSEQAD